MKMFRLVALIAGSLSLVGTNASGAPLFDDAAVLELVLEIPLRELQREDRGIGEVGIVILPDGTRLDVEYETRGHSRLETCHSVPPLWLNFKKKQVDDTVFAGQNKLKLVPHCNKPDRYDDLVLSEYLNYRIFNLLTDASYRVRLSRITYIDQEDDNTIGPRFGFLIEHKDGFAERMGLESLEVDGPVGVSPRQLDPQHSVVFEVFAFMINHIDWSTIRGSKGDDCCHNAHLFKPPGWSGEEGKVIAVGYDFDLTGSVDPPYGDPPMGLRSWKQRKYRGWCWGRSLIDATVEQTQGIKTQIEHMILSEQKMSERRRERMWEFVEEYFEIVDNPKRRENLIHQECRKLPG